MSRQFVGIDYFKFIAALMVVAIHTGAPYYLECVFRVAVPFFFISSSFLFWYKKKNLRDFVKRMALLYLAWFIIEIPFVYQKFAGNGVWFFIKNLLFSNTFFASWYITASIEGMALCFLLSKWFKNRTLLLIGCVLYGVALLGGGYFGVVPNYLPRLVICVDNVIPLTNSLITAFIYCVLGKIFAEKYSRQDFQNCLSIKYLLVALFLIVLYSTEVHFLHPYHRYTDTFLVLPLLAWCLLRFATAAVLWDSDSFYFGDLNIYARKSSTIIYFVHFIVLLVITPFLGFLGDNPIVLHVVKYCSAVSICIIISILIILLSKRWTYLKVLY